MLLIDRNIDRVCKNQLNFQFKSETFDGAVAIQVLHHVKEKERFLRESYRILRRHTIIALHACSHQQMRGFWFYHYFPKGLDIDLARMPDSQEIACSNIEAIIIFPREQYTNRY